MIEARKNENALLLDRYRRMAEGKADAQEIGMYMRNEASLFERARGKSIFDFTQDESLDFQIAQENQKEGNLHKTDGTGYCCPACKNRGYFATKIKDYDEWVYAERECKCIQIRQTMLRVKFSGLGDIFNKCTLDTFNCKYEWQALVKDKAIQFLNSTVSCFYIGGASGSGKSHICTAIVGEMLKRSKRVNYLQWLDLVDDLNNTRFRQVDRYEKIMSDIKNADVLYIDDFLKGDNTVKPSSADIKLAYRIINARYVSSRTISGKRLVTVLSSEWNLEHVDGFDKATSGRINEMARGFVIRLDGDEKNQRKFICKE